MSSNIELKAAVYDTVVIQQYVRDLEVLEKLTLRQRDVFFSVPFFRLKYRTDQIHPPELIVYFRPDKGMARRSWYLRIPVPEVLRKILKPIAHIWPKCGEVSKTRLAYLLSDARIHLDHVDSLGSYVELEVLIDRLPSLEAAKKRAVELQSYLHIPDADICSTAYVDLLRELDESQSRPLAKDPV